MRYDWFRMAPRSDATPRPAGSVPELELDVRPTHASKPKPKPEPTTESPLELAIDPGVLVRERSTAVVPAPPPNAVVSAALAEPVPAAAQDVASDAMLLADYGPPPRHWLFSPLYAWRVLKRRRELKAAWAGRREEAARTANEAEDALIAFGERVRTSAERVPSYASMLQELRQSEETLRSRDRVLASEQDAQNARLSQVDARLSTFEAELALAQSEERAIASELSTSQATLAREEARLKRAEIELRAAQQRAGGGDDT
jgi:hypothetical protein